MHLTKIAHILLSLQPGGAETLVCQLAESSLDEGIPVVIICLDEAGALNTRAEQAGCKVTVVKRKAGLDIGLIFRLAMCFRREGVTVIHSHSLDSMFYSVLAGWLARVPIRIHTQHNTWHKTYGWRERWKFQIGCHFLSKIIAVSDETNRALLPYQIPSSRRQTILNGIDCEKFSKNCSGLRERMGVPQKGLGDCVFGTVARLTPEKGIHHLLEAFSFIHTLCPRSTLLILGDGPLRKELETLCDRHSLRGAVTFLGYQREVREYLAQMDIFVLPSLTEGIPLALLEAMASGLPVIATAVGGIPEVVIHGKSGVLIPAGDSEALRSSMLELVRSPEERLRLSANAEERIREHFGYTVMAQAYRRLYLQEPPAPIWKKVSKNLLRVIPRRFLLWRGRRSRPEVALTFDDGPDPIFTPQILDILNHYKAKATFFVVGEKVVREEGLINRILEEGHEIGNHSFTHPRLDQCSWAEAINEIRQTESLIKDVQSFSSHLFRPPRGKLCLNSFLGAWRENLTVVMWSVDLKDFQAESPGEIISALAEQPISAGDIVLYHGQNPAALAALPRVIESAVEEGRKTVPVSRMLVH